MGDLRSNVVETFHAATGGTMTVRLSLLLTITALFTGIAQAAEPSPVDSMLSEYFVIQSSLAKDTTTNVAPSAAKIAELSGKVPAKSEAAKTALEEIRKAASAIKTADLKTARNHFGELSKRMTAYLQAAFPGERKANQYYCSMAKKGWLQPDKGVRNPYYGSSMLKCGELVN